MSTEVQTPRVKPQTITITDKRELYRCYMPFIKGGGLFIPFNEEVGPGQIFPGQTIFVVFSMLDIKMKTPFSGKVIWINRGGMQKGYGIALGNNPAAKALKENIELAIVDIAQKKEATYTI